MFDVDTFLTDLVACREEAEPRRAAKEVVTRALADPAKIAAAITPLAGGISTLHQSPELTVINVAWAPNMRLMPHNHQMWALIGIYTGAEDNQFFRRDSNGALVDTATRRFETGQVAVLGAETIHAVANSTDRLTAAIHVYGGDFFNEPRSQWGPGDLVERPWDVAEVNRQFEAANAAAGLSVEP